MDKKINDLFTDLNEEINISWNKKIRKIKTQHKFKKWIKDIESNLDKLDISCRKNVKLHKLKTVNFDSFLKNKKLKDIDISNKPNIKDKIILWFKWKMTLWWNMIWVFQKRVFFTKWFFKKLWFSVLSLVIILWLLSLIIEFQVKNGYNKILSIKNHSWDIEYIQSELNSAKLDFIFASILFKPFTIIPNNNIKNWYYLLEWWKNLTKFLDSWIQSYLSLNDFVNKSGWLENIKLTNLITNLKPDLDKLNWLLYNVILSYDNIWDLWNTELNNKFNLAKIKLKQTYNTLNIIDKDFNLVLSLLWHNKEKKYLVLFQNNDEIRATWWFIWSLATVTIKNWKVIDFIKDDVYAYEWEINKVYKNKSPAPEWINKITETFWLRDANYFIDFESSSRSINFFLKKLWKDVDWIIYINQNIILDFLKLTWPVKLDGIDEEITEENFSLLISTLVEAQSFKVWTLWTPKKVLFDFANTYISKLMNDKDYFAYLDIIIKNIKSRDIVLYSFNSEENNLLWKLWLNWRINYSDTLDYSYPVYTSIWWNKSDRYIKLKYEKSIEYNYDCSIDTDLKISRTHVFSKFEEEKVNTLLDKYPVKDKTRKDILNIQWKWVNKSYVRVILPKNIKVFPNKWQHVEKYENSTVVSFYTDTRVLESTNYNIKYRLINTDCKNYSFKLYKQPWIREYSLKILDWNTKKMFEWIKSDFIYKK